MNIGDKVTGVVERMKKGKATVIIVDGQRYILNLPQPHEKKPVAKRMVTK